MPAKHYPPIAISGKFYIRDPRDNSKSVPREVIQSMKLDAEDEARKAKRNANYDPSKRRELYLKTGK